MFILLASNSPRRKQLLGLTGWSYRNVSPVVDERALPQEDPHVYVLRLAEAKARAVYLQTGQGLPDDGVIVAADTTVVLEGEILGKPADTREARDMLQRLAGGIHLVLTGLFAINQVSGRQVSNVCTSRVEMRRYDDAEIEAYIATGDPLDKAGAYAIQHPSFRPVRAVQGCYPNIVGLPLCTLGRLLDHLGYSLPGRLGHDCQLDAMAPCQYYRQMAGMQSAAPNI